MSSPKLDTIESVLDTLEGILDVPSGTQSEAPGEATIFDETDGLVTPGEHSPRVRGKTININRLSKRSLFAGSIENPYSEWAQYQRPKTRADCLPGGCNGERPCPFVSCKHHLYLDVNEANGAIKLNFPDREVWELADSCGLDVADRGGSTLDETGERMNITRERVRQIETRGIDKIKASRGEALTKLRLLR